MFHHNEGRPPYQAIRHGIVPPRRFAPEPSGGGWAIPAVPSMAAVLVWELVFGGVMWAAAAGDPALRGLLMVAGFGGLLTATRRFGVLGGESWSRAMAQAGLLFLGGTCVCNVLLLELGRAPWWR